jgi:hypothetical protein
MKYDPAEQERLIRSAMPTAVYRTSCLLHRKMDEMIKLALRRGITLGIEEYGDESFHKNCDKLEWETMEELADAIFYQAIYHLKEEGVIK